EMLREIIIGSNYTSQNPAVQVFGLGDASSVDSLVVEWPDGRTTTRTNVSAGQTLVVEQPSGG
ncbi:MAG: ASPIC/UnbV domain-containing protein, partial [Gammaproteobacteria bacterium]|nr:ASPIC/UnbV domain-containing protein [Gammaproteobacteria bacterium]